MKTGSATGYTFGGKGARGGAGGSGAGGAGGAEGAEGAEGRGGGKGSCAETEPTETKANAKTLMKRLEAGLISAFLFYFLDLCIVGTKKVGPPRLFQVGDRGGSVGVGVDEIGKSAPGPQPGREAVKVGDGKVLQVEAKGPVRVPLRPGGQQAQHPRGEVEVDQRGSRLG